MADQPRWPRGTPVAPGGHGPGGGRWRDDDMEVLLRGLPAPPDWADEAARRAAGWRAGMHYPHVGMDAARLQALRDSGRKPSRKVQLTGGAIGSVEMLVFDDDHEDIRVVSKEGRPIETAADYLASLIGRAIGAPVPDVIFIDPGLVWMGYVQGDTGNRQAHPMERMEEWVETEEGFRLGLLDYLIHNGDRHFGNWMITPEGRVVGIDHNMAFSSFYPGATFESLLAGVAPKWLEARPHTQTLLALDGGWSREKKIDSGELEGIERRLVALEPEFQKVGKDHWFIGLIVAWNAWRESQERAR